MRRIFHIILSCLLSYNSFAQTTGKIINEHMLPISHVNILIVNPDDSTIIQNTISSSDGTFHFDKNYTGKLLKISSIGYITQHLIVQKEHMGCIIMSSDNKILKEIIVKGRHQLIESTPSGIIYNMKKDPLAKSANLLSALRNVPLVDIDGKGGIWVKGSRDYSIYLNGKPYRMANMSPKEILQGIPASTIAKVEVITQLDARYDGSTQGNIINIITDKRSIDGYKMTILASAETQPKLNAGFTQISTHGKWDYSLGYNYNMDKYNHQPIEAATQYFNPLKTHSVQGESKGTYNTHTIHGMAEYAIDSVNSIYFDSHILLENINSRGERDETVTSIESAHSHYTTRMDKREGAIEANIIYRNLFKKDRKEHFLFGYRYTYNPDKRYNVFEQEVKTRRKTDGGMHEHTIETDYVIPFNKYCALKIGGKEIVRLSSTNPTYEEWNNTSKIWQHLDTKIVDAYGALDLTQSITSAYASYTYRRKKLSLDLGLRIEYSHTNIKFDELTNNNHTSNLLDFIPRTSLSYKIGQSSQFSMSYSRRLIRPSIWSINPFYSKSSNYYYFHGNPNLKSEHINTIGLSFLYYNNYFTINTSADYLYADDVIMKYQYSKDNIIYSTFGNIGKKQKTSVTVYGNYRPNQTLSMTVSLNAGYMDIKSANTGQHNFGLTYNIFLATDVSFHNGWNMGANLGHFKQEMEIDCNYSPFTSYTFYVSKSLLRNKLNIALNIETPFCKYIKAKSTVFNADFRNIQTNYIVARSFGVSLSYSFKSGKSTTIKRNLSIKNEDIKEQTGVR